MNRGAHLLVIDDDPGLRAGLYDLLSLYGFVVRTAEDGLEALAMMEGDPPDLILSDIVMPKMDGYQFYQRVRSQKAWGGIPFIFLTARKVEDDRQGWDGGDVDTIEKPFEPEDLVEIVLARLAKVKG
jgi:DNA-binding response OmpR family regulator